MTTYESVLALIGRVPAAPSPNIRDIKWVTDARRIGVSRDHNGKLEVFLKGTQLAPSSQEVREAIEFRAWHRDGSPPIDANRLLFPAVGHFDQVAAFVCVELLRAGADTDLHRAFAKTEPIIELAIQRLRISTEATLGLVGELLLLDALCRQAVDEQVARVAQGWAGWMRSSRDFSWGSTGVEVKTTMGATSSHSVEGIHQVERNSPSEERLFVVSVGLQAAEPSSNSFSIPQLVDRIATRLDEVGASREGEQFVFRVSEYGTYSGAGYDHRTMSDDPGYGAFFLTAFFRGYEMSDEGVRVLRRRDVVAHEHVDVDSLTFRIALPQAISLGNPVEGANRTAEAILTSPAGTSGRPTVAPG